MKSIIRTYHTLLAAAMLVAAGACAQPQINAKLDARQIVVGDQVRMFIEAKPAKGEKLIWANMPDTFNNLEIVEKGKIDTVQQDGLTLYKQRLLITGWDSGMFQVPAFEFTSVPATGNPYKVTTDSFSLIVQTIPVDTTQSFRPIADILPVKTTWRDYIWYILGGLLAIGLVIFIIWYFRKNKGIKAPVPLPKKPAETPGEKALRMLNELEMKELWQHDHVKQYYTELTDILRTYIEERFRTPAMELTSDEIIDVAHRHKEMMRHTRELEMILQTADMAKFAKAKPLPQEHTDAFEYTRQFVTATKPQPVTTENKDTQ